MFDNFLQLRQNNQNLNNEETKNKRLFLLGIIAFVVLVIVIIIAFIIYKLNEPPKDAGEEYTSSVYFDNRYLLTANLDTNPSYEVSSHIESVILNQDEINSAPEENQSITDDYITYSVSIDELSLKQPSDQPMYTFTFDITVSDGRKYSIIAYEDSSQGRYYIGTIIKRKDTTTKDFVFYDYNEDALYYGEYCDYKATLEEWISSFELTEPVYNTSTLIVEEQ